MGVGSSRRQAETAAAAEAIAVLEARTADDLAADASDDAEAAAEAAEDAAADAATSTSR